jgi:hypothetical protein
MAKDGSMRARNPNSPNPSHPERKAAMRCLFNLHKLPYIFTSPPIIYNITHYAPNIPIYYLYAIGEEALSDFDVVPN